MTGFAGTFALGLAHGVAETRLPVVGLLAVGRPDGQPSPVARVIPSALAALGWKDGQNFRLLVREGNGEFDSLEPLMDELLRTPVDVIVAASGIVTSRLLAHTRSIPIVMSASGVDPVQAGWAESYARPGSNVTGLTLSNDEAIPKLVQLLKEAAPNMKQLGFLKTRSNTTTTQKILDIGRTAAVAIGIKTHVGLVEDIGEVEGELERLHRAGHRRTYRAGRSRHRQFSGADCGGGHRAEAADCRPGLLLCRGRIPPHLCAWSERDPPPSGDLCRPHSSWRTARRPADRAPKQIALHPQPEDRKTDEPHGLSDPTLARADEVIE